MALILSDKVKYRMHHPSTIPFRTSLSPPAQAIRYLCPLNNNVLNARGTFNVEMFSANTGNRLAPDYAF